MPFGAALQRRRARVAIPRDDESDSRRHPKPAPTSDLLPALGLSTSNNASAADQSLPPVWGHSFREQGRKERTKDKLTRPTQSQLREWRGREQTTCCHRRLKE